jgi:prepilin-type processing-associated H-X9-DG protein
LTSEGTKILDSRTAGKIIFCPSAPGRGWSNYTYGPCGINRNRSADTYQSVSSVSTPAGALLFADSAAPGDGNYTFNPNNRGVYVSTWQDLHYRHAGKANSVFLDGHVQSLTPEEAQARPAYFTSLRGF